MLEGLLSRAKTPERVAELEAELSGPPLPPELAYLWGAYLRLSARRGGGFGPSPITWSDLAAFQALTGFRFTPWEVEMIETLDTLQLADPKEAADV